MTLLDDAQVITTANSYKAGTLYSIKPDSGACDLDITRSTTATRVNPDGNIESVAINEPQLDYTDGCGCLWIEPASTNLMLYSEELDNATNWKPGDNVVVTANDIASPDGTTNADKCTIDNGYAQMYQNVSLAASTTYTWSFYAKRGTMTDVKMLINNRNGDGAYVSRTSYYSDISATGWSRISVTFTSGTNAGDTFFYPIQSPGVTGTVYLWGFQLEQHSADSNKETSYIPTTSAAVSRTASSFIKTGVSGTIGSSEGVYFAEIAYFHNGTSAVSEQSLIGLNDSNNDAIYQIGKWNTDFIGFTRDTAGNNVLFSNSITVASEAFVKMAIKYKAGDHAYWKDGVEIATSTDATAIPATQDRIISSYKGNSGFWEFYGKIRSIQVYNTALTDAQLTSLTS